MSTTFTPDQRDIIARHKHDTTLYILAATPPLAAVADAAAKRIPKPRVTKQGTYGRSSTRVLKDDSRRIGPKEASWCLAILVDATASWKDLLQLGRRIGVNGLARVKFYLREGKDPVAILEPWTALDSTPDYALYSDETDLVKHVLQQLNDQTLRDQAGGAVPGVP